MNLSYFNFILKSNYSFSVYRGLSFRSKHKHGRFFINNDIPVKPRKHKKFPLFIDHNKKLASKISAIPKQKFDYFLILDFEATCDSPINVEPPEIIEFPVLKINGKTFETEAVFHSYVKPLINPYLSSFCSELTGIIQSMVESQPSFKTVFEKFLTWMKEEGVLESDIRFAFVTCGDPDLDYLLPVQCVVSEIDVPEYMKEWINIKRSFCDISPYVWPDNLSKMLRYCELEAEGDLHSGIDDAKNIARVLKDLAERGLVFDINGRKKT